MSDNFATSIKPTWCPGCLNFAVLTSLKKVFQELNLKSEKVAIAYDIGCSGNMGNFLKTSSFFGLHGRAVPLAAGIKLANPKLTVFAIGGDGGQLGEGANHLVHAARRNDDITLLILNNLVFSLTTGQVSPTTPLEMKTKTTPGGNKILPTDAVSLSLAADASFVSRVFVGDIDLMVDVFKKAVMHRGFALVEILAPCATFSQEFNFNWFRQRVIPINKPFLKVEEAFRGAKQGKEKIPVGIFFQEERETFNNIASFKVNTSEADIKEVFKDFT
jgi:2-oxoglutarate ferredoxin oxidoreductase subunit beta